jgi:hypothetical protein
MMTGTSVRPSWRAAASRPCPATMSPSSPIRSGLEKPNALMLPAISATWVALCVRALRGEGMSRSTGQVSSRMRLWQSSCAIALPAMPVHRTPPPRTPLGGGSKKNS